MIREFKKIWSSVDFVLVASLIPLLCAGLFTMNSFTGEGNFFSKQVIWIGLSFVLFFILSNIDFHFLRKTSAIVTIFGSTCLILALLFVLGKTVKGATSWFSFGFFSFQPADLAKIALILLLAKYFSKRHVEIANVRHIFVSGFYALILFTLVLLQPDLGSAIIIFLIWFGMVLVSGISKKHLALVVALGIISVAVLWFSVFNDIQKARIISFVHPLADIRGTGYNAYQSTIAVGSGQIFGKGIGQGSQSKLLFLPEYQTDFIFAAFAEEWGFVGTIILLMLSLILLFRIVNNAEKAPTNFETLVGLGTAIFLSLHITVHAGMNVGILPVTGIPFPFMSYGGSHLLNEWFVLGILSSMKRRSQGPRG